MKKVILGIILGAICSLGFNTVSASAANCQAGATSMGFHNPGPYAAGPFYGPIITNCSGVSGVQINHSINGTQFTGWYDGTWAAWSGTYMCQSINAPGCTNIAQTEELGVKVTYNGGSSYFWRPAYANAWHSIAQTYWWRIRNSIGNTWGSWQFYIGPTISAFV